ncbi:cytochrome P450 [Nocardia iowensis]
MHFAAERGMWFVTARDLVAEALNDHATFSSAFGLPQLPIPDSIKDEVAEIQAEGWPPVPTLLTADPPEHHYYRRMLAKAFTPRFIARLEPDIRAIARELVQALPNGTATEFVRGFAAPLPLRVIAKVLNVPGDRIDDFKRWSDQFTATVGGQLDDAGLLEQARNMVEFQKYFAAQLDDRRADPQDDLLTGLVTAHNIDNDEPLGTGAILNIIVQLLVAGNETSTKLIAGVLHELAREPEHWDRLRAQPSEHSGNLIEEGLRLLSPVQSMFRITKTEAELGGYTIPSGQLVVLVFGSANRDEQWFDNPDDFDPDRANAKAHLAFGAGIHACLGAPLARLESRVAVEELAARFASVRLDEDNDFAYEPSFMLRGFRRLSLVFTEGRDT